MGRADRLKLGQWNAICDRCSLKFKNVDLKETWDNLYVCKDCFEHRHPMDFFKGQADDQSVPWSRPVGPYVPIDRTYTNIVGPAIIGIAIVGFEEANPRPIGTTGQSNIAGQAYAGTAIAGYFLTYTNPL